MCIGPKNCELWSTSSESETDNKDSENYSVVIGTWDHTVKTSVSKLTRTTLTQTSKTI